MTRQAAKTALVVSLSELRSDPRIRRQIDWLTGAGIAVDTLGLGDVPSDQVRRHYAMLPQKAWVRTRWGSVLIYLLLPGRSAFRQLTENRIPSELSTAIAGGGYDVIVFNERDFLPWVGSSATFTPAALAGRLHLDLHEYHEPRFKLKTRWRVLALRYYKWVRRFIGDSRFTSHTTVASGLSDAYVHDFGLPELDIVRNSPPFEQQDPSPVDPTNIRLVFHGLGSRARGLHDILDAMRLLDDRFSVTFMLTSNAALVDELREYGQGLGDRFRIVPPVPMRELSTVVNQYDLEIMFYRPTSKNLEFALPNKFFEAIQGRLGLVIGESPMMAELVNAYGNGVVIQGWTATDLATAIGALSADDVTRLKAASHRAASELNAEAEGAVFLRSVGIVTTDGAPGGAH